jgi:hypothetical protein
MRKVVLLISTILTIMISFVAGCEWGLDSDESDAVIHVGTSASGTVEPVVDAGGPYYGSLGDIIELVGVKTTYSDQIWQADWIAFTDYYGDRLGGTWSDNRFVAHFACNTVGTFLVIAEAKIRMGRETRDSTTVTVTGTVDPNLLVDLPDVSDAQLLPDGRHLMCLMTTGDLWVVDIGTREVVDLTGKLPEATSFAVTMEQSVLLIGTSKGEIMVYEYPSLVPRNTIKVHAEPVGRISAAEGVGRVISVTQDYTSVTDTLVMTDVAAGEVIGRCVISNAYGDREFAITRDGDMVVYCNANVGLHRIRWEQATILNSNKRFNLPIVSLAVSPDGEHAVCGEGYGQVGLWNTTSGTRIKTLGDCSSHVIRLAMSRDGKYTVAGDQDGTVGVYELPPGTYTKRWKAGDYSLCGLAFTNDGSKVITVSQMGVVKSWPR